MSRSKLANGLLWTLIIMAWVSLMLHVWFPGLRALALVLMGITLLTGVCWGWAASQDEHRPMA